MDAQIVIDLETGTPPYEQIQAQISSLIAVGLLSPGTRLPTVRALAADLGVAAGTVARAYKELEALGIVITNRRQGTVVADAGVAEAGRAEAVSRQSRPQEANGGVPEVMAAVDHLLELSEAAGLDGKHLMALLQGKINQRGTQ